MCSFSNLQYVAKATAYSAHCLLISTAEDSLTCATCTQVIRGFRPFPRRLHTPRIRGRQVFFHGSFYLTTPSTVHSFNISFHLILHCIFHLKMKIQGIHRESNSGSWRQSRLSAPWVRCINSKCVYTRKARVTNVCTSEALESQMYVHKKHTRHNCVYIRSSRRFGSLSFLCTTFNLILLALVIFVDLHGTSNFPSVFVYVVFSASIGTVSS